MGIFPILGGGGLTQTHLFMFVYQVFFCMQKSSEWNFRIFLMFGEKFPNVPNFPSKLSKISEWQLQILLQKFKSIFGWVSHVWFLLLAIVSLWNLSTFYFCNKFTFTVFFRALSEATTGDNPFFIWTNNFFEWECSNTDNSQTITTILIPWEKR